MKRQIHSRQRNHRLVQVQPAVLFALFVFVGFVPGTCVGASSPSPGADLFTNGSIPRLRLQVDRAALATLRKEPRTDVVAQVVEGSTVYPKVAIHLKGSVGSFQPVDEKPSLTLDFAQFNAQQRFHGLRKIHLNNSLQDPSLVNEKLASEFFLSAGLPAPRVARAIVTFNGRNLGPYVLKEGFTEDFLACHFDHIGGELYEPVGGSDIDGKLKRNTVLAPASNARADLAGLANAAREKDPAERWQRLNRGVDMNRFIPFMALEVMLGHRDGYSIARNNFRVYHDVDSGKIVFFPHGMDVLMGTAELPWQPFMGGLVASAVLSTPEGKARYASTFNSLFTKLFRSQALTRRVDELTRELQPFLSRKERARVKAEALVVKDRIVQRQLNLRSQLSSERPTPSATTSIGLLPRHTACRSDIRGPYRNTTDNATLAYGPLFRQAIGENEFEASTARSATAPLLRLVSPKQTDVMIMKP